MHGFSEIDVPYGYAVYHKQGGPIGVGETLSDALVDYWRQKTGPASRRHRLRKLHQQVVKDQIKNIMWL